ncbi:ABC-F family ATP-binding cassette domain-containing protein [Enterocloster sp. OA13]|uniref:ABC-F family ATP-binding cassette domain-containing protein n=1 Tax=Enterocloster hominis (ex Hitch et al. 2024) TaxID=1917870 RepID=A0ABV1D9Q1_9FIRM|nr:ABC-F family ATP-binding cassette domain-containing protein [Lachnoclostridium pacaense]MCC2817983.1 ABC-F family ATP-binding cassette domain-containing protein [Lachnoclostridium pacaense]MCC2875778.1 ABC-F family ATP-binding cassette domain-containing protein [Lachnoclostridium pacaense]MCH1949201.1 ABC-F family ATP-binding cassette domain-containing protein [Enterocloster sp. OA13]
MILSCSNITKSFGDKHILKQVSFHLEDHEKAAIVGINGAGKTTLLKIIIGELAADEGVVALSKGSTIGYLAQHQDLDSESTIYEALLEVKRPVIQMEERIRSLELKMHSASGDALEAMLAEYSRLNHAFELANGYAYKSEVTGVLKGLGFSEDEFTKPINTLSGGQKTRVSLGKLLLTKPDVLLLDEPTNHLDMESIAWLETYLKGYSGSVIIVAHDRYFLDRVVSKIVELDNGIGTMFSGNYSAYSDKKAMLRDAKIRAYLNQQQEIKHQEAVITKLKSFNREKSIRRAESREKMLDKIERLDKPVEIDDSMDIRLEPDVISGNDVLTVRELSKSFDAQTLFSHVDFDIKRGERVAIIGNNGTGKTTLLKIINGLLEADSGEIRLGSKVHIGYYDQEHQVLHMDKTLFEEIQDTYPDMNNTQIRNTLASFLFTGDDVFKLIRDLSGGERGRVSLAKLMLSDANFLLLDEPTNHLDITSKEILESALCRYTGTVLYVSHDRYFINRTATRILDLTSQSLINYIGNYDYYLEKKDDVEAAFAARNAAGQAPAGTPDRDLASSSASDIKLDWKARKEEQARIRKRQNELKKTEDSIHALETRDSEIDGLLSLEEVYTDVDRLMELNREKEEIARQLEELYERWEELAED